MNNPDKKSMWRRALHQVKPFRRHMVGIFVLNLLATPLGLLVPVPLKIAVDSVIGTTPLPAILAAWVPDFVAGSKLNLLIFAVGMQISVVVLMQLQSLSGHSLRTKVGEKMTLAFRTRLFHQAQRLSLLFHDHKGTTDSIYRIQYDAPSIQWLTIYGFLPSLSASITLLSMIYVIARLNWHLALVALTIVPPLFFYSRFYNRRMRPRYKETKQLESNALKVIQEVLTAIRVVKVFGREDDEEERFKQQSGKNAAAKIRLALAEGGFGLIVNFTTALGSAAVLFIGVLNVQSGGLTVGELLMIITYLGQLYSPVKSLSNQVKTMQSALASLQR
ncbi:MAG: ABC transporter ATP-binding protein, partial [Deltaproteobacteria bacterium]|nr:ABC transporter ATP-binding protein [Deltaproteobacteria bacterium]